MVTDRMGPTITTLKAEVDFLGGELAAAREEIERLRAALKLFACDCTGKELCQLPQGCTNYIARIALEG
jgi:hypothetical protein